MRAEFASEVQIGREFRGEDREDGTGPVEVRNPPRAQVLGGGVVLVSQTAAEAAEPRLLLQPVSTTARNARSVDVDRRATTALIAQFLRPLQAFVSRIRIEGTWVRLGTTTSSSDGQLSLPAVRMAKAGTFPVRLIEQSRPNRVLHLILAVSYRC